MSTRSIVLLLVAVLTILEPTKSLPTLIPLGPCAIEDFKDCAQDQDANCEAKNTEIKQKQAAICQEHPDCQFCNSSLSVDIEKLNDETILVEPEIVPTINPPLDSENVPIDETIIIDAAAFDPQKNKDQKALGKLVERNIIIENDNQTQYYKGYVDPSSNITTIIRLTNLINNTNIVNMPTTLNNTNVNNIHVYSNKSSENGGKFGLGYTKEGPCCWMMKPGSCKRTTVGLKCRHKKSKVCGRQCNKKVIHPGRAPCSQWPCPYQQYQPFMPYPIYPQFSAATYPIYEDDHENDEDDDLPQFPEDEELENPEMGWVVMQEKCKIVSEDGLHITNCSDSDNKNFDHPYARNSYGAQHKRAARHAKEHSNRVPIHQPYAQMYGYPVMPQMYYVQPIPIFVPQYYQPQQNVDSYPQQLPFPPQLDADQYYEEPIIEHRASNPYKKSRKHSKKHPIIVEHDDEL